MNHESLKVFTRINNTISGLYLHMMNCKDESVNAQTLAQIVVLEDLLKWMASELC